MKGNIKRRWRSCNSAWQQVKKLRALFWKKAFVVPLQMTNCTTSASRKTSNAPSATKKIWRILANYSYANPKVPEINEIVPLPPAPLPAWDSKLQWLEARRANVPPEKPSAALINQLAKDKVLDPATGKPMPGSPAFSQANFPVLICYSGETCPRAGYWKVIWPAGRTVRTTEVIRHFKEGEAFPRQIVERFHLRPWPLSDKTSYREQIVEWGLLR